MFAFRWGAAATCFALSVVPLKVAHAQTDRDRAAARSAADAGADAFEQGHYSESLDLFSRAEQLFHAPTHLLFIARSQVKLSRLVDAHETYLKIIKETQPAQAPAVFRKAQGDAERENTAVAARIAHVTVTVQGTQPTGLVLLVDGAELSAANVGIPLPIDPGVHVFRARAGGAQSEEISQSFGDGAEESVALTLDGQAPASPAVAAPETIGKTAPIDHGSGASTAQRNWGIVALAAGAGAIGVGGYFTASSHSSRKAGQASYNACDPGCSDEQQQSITRDYAAADRSTVRSIVSYAVGGVGVVTGLVLLLTSSTHDNASAAQSGFASVRVVAGTNWVGAAGTF